MWVVVFQVKKIWGVVFQVTKIWEPQHFGKSWKDKVNLGQIEKLSYFRVAGAQTLAIFFIIISFFLKLLEKTYLVIGLSDKTILNSV